MAEHPWKLVGPWYRTQSVGGSGGHRNSAPIFQKYAATDFANRIVAEPQKSLKFVGEDFVDRITPDPDQVVTPALRGDKKEPLKLFLDLHSRFYVVICELHCDLAGFPSVERDKVCEAGFVVRRRVPDVPKEASSELGKIMRQRGQLKGRIRKAAAGQGSETANLEEHRSPQPLSQYVRSRANRLRSDIQAGQLQSLKSRFELNSEALNDVTKKFEIKLVLQGWEPTGLKGVGNWKRVDPNPQQLDEQVYPLFPLHPDPTASEHSAAGRTLWFGVVPTGSGDCDSEGNAKFDDDDLYEVQCFVRRHKTQCPKKTNQTDCSGELVWSRPTEGYRLASPYDIDGGGHRPVNIKLPDLDALKAQADLGPPGRGVNARVIAPPNSSLNFKTDEMDMPEAGSPLTRPGQQVCFFAIFLFFIVALFLFRLFLPIVLFLFQLWFLLKLKFCIPPSVEFGADLAVELKVKGPELEAKFAADASFSIEVGGQIFTNANKDDLKKLISESVSSEVNASAGFQSDISDGILNSLSLDQLAELYVTMKTEYADVQNEELAGELSTPERGLVYFDKVSTA